MSFMGFVGAGGGGGGGGTPGGTATQLQFNNSGVFGGVAGSGVDASGSITLGGATVTSSDPVISMTQTWNNASTVFTGIKLNITNTNAANVSRLLDLQIGGSTVAGLGIAGVDSLLWLGGSSGNTPSFSNWVLMSDNSGTFLNTPAPGGGFNFTHNNNSNGFNLFCDANNIAAIRTGATATTFRVYNTWTDSSDFERGTFDWNLSSNVLTVGVENLGTGSQRAMNVGYNCSTLALQTGTVQRFSITSTGSVLCAVQGAISTSATDGFLYIPTCAGAPSGTPTTHSGMVALVWDTTDHKFYVYDGAWKGGTAPGVWS